MLPVWQCTTHSVYWYSILYSILCILTSLAGVLALCSPLVLDLNQGDGEGIKDLVCAEVLQTVGGLRLGIHALPRERSSALVADIARRGLSQPSVHTGP